MVTIKNATIDTFSQFFFKAFENFTSKSGIEYTTFIASIEALNQLIPGNFPIEKVIKTKDNSHNECKLYIRVNPKFGNGDFKKMVTIFNTKTNERIALVGL
jgi:hypothetical protein